MGELYQIELTGIKNRYTYNFSILYSRDVEEALEVLRSSFFPNENVHKVLKVSENPKAVEEIERLVRNACEGGVSIIARCVATKKIAGVAINKIQHEPTSSEKGYFEKLTESFTQPESRGVMNFMIDVDGKANLFTKYQTPALFEVMFLATHVINRREKIATDLFKLSIKVAKQARAGAVTVLCTSPYTYQISLNLGFEEHYREFWKNHQRDDGVTYSKILDLDSFYTLSALKL